ncbi:MAG: hypothetical protein WC711_01180 [Candidatus Staskawiczbacteria bacterium]|jgi:hypothetical protein
MDFIIKNVKESISNVARKLGYVIIDTKPNGEYNLVRKLSGNSFPRFHAYTRQAGTDFTFSLHLDQKAPVYGGNSHAHNGEYFGPIIDEEADRIRQILGVS